jgi:hypothetical protein
MKVARVGQHAMCNAHLQHATGQATRHVAYDVVRVCIYHAP